MIPLDIPPPTDLQRRKLAAVLDHAPLSVLAVVLLPPLFWWLHGHYGATTTHSSWMLPAWVLFMWLLAGALVLALRRLRQRPPDDDRRWQLQLALLATGVGLAWTAPVLITLREPQPQFHLILYASLCAVTSSGAMYLSLLPALFLSFSGCVLSVLIGCAYWIFPREWPFMVVVVLLFAAITMRHAVQNYRFMETQLTLEEGYRQMSARASQALLEKNHFLNAASHDLRQPVQAMSLVVEAALQQHQPPTLAPLLQHLRQCAHSIEFMLESLLDLARIESGRHIPHPQCVCVQDMLSDVQVIFGPQAQTRSLALRLRAPLGQLLYLHADPALLRQALFNLVQNAVRYTRRGGILVTARVRGPHVLLQVWDTGAGIAEHEQARIFAPFERGSADAPLGSGAHGLGLAVVARSAALMGAAYGLRSVPGRGSCFWLELPRAPAPARARAHSAAAPAMRRLPGRCLIVEDDPEVARGWSLLFAAWGTTARFAHSHADAHALLDEGFEPQALVCDLRLGSGNGWQLLQALAGRCPEAGCLLISADLDAPEFSQADDEGCLVMRKPVAPADLHRALQAWLSS
jgi:signal transduction histidine kinase/CheY-like chemotaxis protein